MRGTEPRGRARTLLVSNHDVPDGHSLKAVLRSVLGRHGLDESFLVIWANGNDDLFGRKARKRVADGKGDFRLAGNGINRLSGKPLGRAFSDPLCLTKCFFVVGEPVEDALPCDGDHHLDCVVLAELSTQGVVRMLNRADDEDVLAQGALLGRPLL